MTNCDTWLASDQKWEFGALAPQVVASGVPTQRFRKQIGKVGQYRTSDGKQFAAPLTVLSHLASNFQKMKRNGVEVTIPSSHEAHGDSRENFGHVTDMFVDGDALVMACELSGEDAILAASRNNVSMGLLNEYKDGSGKTYDGLCVRHVTMTPTPVIPGLAPFYEFSETRKASPMNFTEIQKALGTEAELSEKNVGAEITKALEGAGTLALAEVAKVTGAEVKDVAGINLAIDKFVEQKVTAGVDAFKVAKKGDAPAAWAVNMAQENGAMKLSQLVEASKITPAVSDALKALFLSEESTSLCLAETGKLANFNSVMEILSQNDPVQLAESRTRGQSGAPLSDPAKCDDKMKNLAIARREEAQKRDRQIA